MDDYLKGCSDYWNGMYAKVPENKITGNFPKKRMELRLILESISGTPTIADLGCGLGVIGGVMSALYPGIKYTGIDISKEAVNRVQSVWKLPAKLGDLRDIPLPNEYCDTVFALDCLEHIRPEDRSKVYSEINRILRDHGVIFLNFCLEPSYHKSNYDFGFSHNDLFELTNSVNGFITRVTPFTIQTKRDMRTYYFVVIGKDIGRRGIIALNPKERSKLMGEMDEKT